MSHQWRKGLPVNLSATDSLVLEYMTSEGLVDTCGSNGPAQAANQVQTDLSNFQRSVLSWAGLTPMAATHLLPLFWEGMGGTFCRVSACKGILKFIKNNSCHSQTKRGCSLCRHCSQKNPPQCSIAVMP